MSPHPATTSTFVNGVPSVVDHRIAPVLGFSATTRLVSVAATTRPSATTGWPKITPPRFAVQAERSGSSDGPEATDPVRPAVRW